MVIDIISYTPAQYAEMTTEQIVEVREAQEKKNRLEKQLAKDLFNAEKEHIERGTYHSTVYQKRVENLQAGHDLAVENLREALVFYLQYGSRPTQSANIYPIDFSLSYSEREAMVREYYFEHYADPVERFEAYKADRVALQYLGERYAPLYDYLYDFAREALQGKA